LQHCKAAGQRNGGDFTKRVTRSLPRTAAILVTSNIERNESVAALAIGAVIAAPAGGSGCRPARSERPPTALLPMRLKAAQNQIGDPWTVEQTVQRLGPGGHPSRTDRPPGCSRLPSRSSVRPDCPATWRAGELGAVPGPPARRANPLSVVDDDVDRNRRRDAHHSAGRGLDADRQGLTIAASFPRERQTGLRDARPTCPLFLTIAGIGLLLGKQQQQRTERVSFSKLEGSQVFSDN
jgi:hypothetical protein